MEGSGKPTNVELFVSKLMKTCKTTSHSLKIIELCGYKAITKPLKDKRKDERVSVTLNRIAKSATRQTSKRVHTR